MTLGAHATDVTLAAARGQVPASIAVRVVSEAARGSIRGAVCKEAIAVGMDGRVTVSRRGTPIPSPESLAGGEGDERGDVFALGVVLWELLAGREIFPRGDGAATRRLLLENALPDVRTLADVDAAIADVVTRATERDRGRRIASAEALRDALAQATRPASDAEIAAWARTSASIVAAPDLGIPDLAVPLPSSRKIPVAAPVAPVPAPSSGGMTIDTNDDDLAMHIERDIGGVQAMGMQQRAPMVRTTSGVIERPRIPVASTGLEITYTRPTRERPVFHEEEASLALRAGGYAVATTFTIAATALLIGLAHRTGGHPLASAVPSAFTGTSAPHSGAVSLLGLVLAVGLGFIGVKSTPRSWTTIAAAGAMLLASLAMVTVTLVATEPNPGPADGLLVMPYLVPFALFMLALGVAGRSAYTFTDDRLARRALAIPIAALAGLLVFVAIETSKLASLF